MEKIFYIIDSISNTHSITETAKTLHLTVPAVSIALKKEEDIIGCLLVDRQSKPIKLTETGEIYLKYYHKIKPLDDDLKREREDFLMEILTS